MTDRNIHRRSGDSTTPLVRTPLKGAPSNTASGHAQPQSGTGGSSHGIGAWAWYLFCRAFNAGAGVQERILSWMLGFSFPILRRFPIRFPRLQEKLPESPPPVNVHPHVHKSAVVAGRVGVGIIGFALSKIAYGMEWMFSNLKRMI